MYHDFVPSFGNIHSSKASVMVLPCVLVSFSFEETRSGNGACLVLTMAGVFDAQRFPGGLPITNCQLPKNMFQKYKGMRWGTPTGGLSRYQAFPASLLQDIADVGQHL